MSFWKYCPRWLLPGQCCQFLQSAENFPSDRKVGHWAPVSKKSTNFPATRYIFHPDNTFIKEEIAINNSKPNRNQLHTKRSHELNDFPRKYSWESWRDSGSPLLILKAVSPRSYHWKAPDYHNPPEVWQKDNQPTYQGSCFRGQWKIEHFRKMAGVVATFPPTEP